MGRETAKRKQKWERVAGQAQVLADRLKKDHGIEAQGFIRQIAMQASSRLEVAEGVLATYKLVEKMVKKGGIENTQGQSAKLGDSYGLRKEKSARKVLDS